MSTLLVVDLGTVFTRATWIVRDAQGRITSHGKAIEVASVLSWEDEQRSWSIGERARRRLLTDPRVVVSAPKLLLGRAAGDFSRIFAPWSNASGPEGGMRVRCGERAYPTEVLVAALLASVKQDAQTQARALIREAIYIAPAWLHDAALRALADASRLALLEPVAFVDHCWTIAAALIHADATAETPATVASPPRSPLVLDDGADDDERVPDEEAATEPAGDPSPVDDPTAPARVDVETPPVLATESIKTTVPLDGKWLLVAVGQGGSEVGVLHCQGGDVALLGLRATVMGCGQQIDERAAQWLSSRFSGETSGEGLDDVIARARILDVAHKLQHRCADLDKSDKVDIHLPYLRADADGVHGLTAAIDRTTWRSVAEPALRAVSQAIAMTLRDAQVTGKELRGVVLHGPLSRWAWRQVAHANGLSVKLDERIMNAAALLDAASSPWLSARTKDKSTTCQLLGRDLYWQHEQGHVIPLITANTPLVPHVECPLSLPVAGRWRLLEGVCPQRSRDEVSGEVWGELGELDVPTDVLANNLLSAMTFTLTVNNQRRIDVHGVRGPQHQRLVWQQSGKIRLDRAVFRRLRYDAMVADHQQIERRRELALRDYCEQNARRVERALTERQDRFEDLIRPRMTELVKALRDQATASTSIESSLMDMRQRWLDFLAVITKSQREAIEPAELDMPVLPPLPDASECVDIDPYAIVCSAPSATLDQGPEVGDGLSTSSDGLDSAGA